MSLVNQFEITLKDFLPDRCEGMIITDRDRGTTTTVSNRLYARLRAYADANRIPLDTVVEQLREETHQQPIATIDPTASQQKFAKGDRVKLSVQGIQALEQPASGMRMPRNRSGTVAHNSEKNGVAVRWDGTKTAQYIFPILLEPYDD